ncbi:MAG: rhodanese-like domain-containing protein [Eubacterium sp.]
MEKNSSALRKFSVLLLAASITTAFSGMSTIAAHAATVKPSKISVKSSLSMTTADPAKLSVKLYPSNAKAALTYTSSNTSIASVSKTGKITGKKLGTTYITVKTKGAKGKTLSKKVKVKVGICSSTKTSEVLKYASDKSSHTILIDARSADAYSGWALDGAKRGGHLSNAVNFSADWINADYSVKKTGTPAGENLTTKDYLNREISANKMTKSNSYIVYDTNGKDAKAVAKYLINTKGFRSVCTYNAKNLINKGNVKTSSYKNYSLYVPASLVKNISDHKVKGTALNATAKKLVGSSKNIVILHAEYNATGRYNDDWSVYYPGKTLDWSQSSYATTGHVPGALAISTDDFEPQEATDRSTSTSYRLLHTSDGQIDDAKLISLVEKYGITKDSCVIVTAPNGQSTALAAARIAVILKYLGVDNTHIMSGLLHTWTNDGYALEKTINTAKKSSFGASKALNPDVIDTTSEFEAGLKKSDFQGIDTRTKAEWDGLSSGYDYHDLAGRIAGTVFSPSGENWNSSVSRYQNPDYTMRSASEIKALWKADGVDSSKHLSFFCGSGWRASVTLWDAWVMGYNNASLYSDGWQVWSNAGLPYIDKDGKTVHYDSKTKTVVAYTDSTSTTASK